MNADTTQNTEFVSSDKNSISPHETANPSAERYYIESDNGVKTLYSLSFADIAKKIEEDPSLASRISSEGDLHVSLVKQTAEVLNNKELSESERGQKLRPIVALSLSSLFKSFEENDPVLNTKLNNTKEIVDSILRKYDDRLLNLFRPEFDYTTVNHCINVMALTVSYYQVHPDDLNENGLEDVALGALLHDIGKLHLMDLVRSNKVFNQEEKNRMMSHPVLGYNSALEMGIKNKCILSAIYNHHRRVDNTGYPEIKPDLIPTDYDFLLGLIDSFEAMTSDKRPYKVAMAPMEALEILRNDSLKNMYDWNMYSKFVRSLSIESNYTPASDLLSFSSY